jgi:hypothetical protein
VVVVEELFNEDKAKRDESRGDDDVSGDCMNDE